MGRFLRPPVWIGLLIVLALSLPAAWLQALAAQGGGEVFSAEGPPVVIRAEHIEGGSTARLLPAPAVLGEPGAQRSLAEGPQASVNIIFKEPSDWDPRAQQAVQYAANLWARELSSPIPITIEASWEPLAWGVLGSAGPTLVTDFRNQPVPGFAYPSALADKFAGEDLKTGLPDISMTFSSTFPWYYGTDGKITDPSQQYDLVTVVMHELGHGLGFIGSLRWSGGVGYIGFDGFPYPLVYDQYVKNSQGAPILSYPNSSFPLGSQLISSNLYFTGPRLMSLSAGAGAKLYAPNPWEQGSSYSHFDEAFFFKGNANSLMTPRVANGEVVHVPGPYALAVLEDLGWGVSQDWSQVPTATTRPTVLPTPPGTPTPTRAPGVAPVFMPLLQNTSPQQTGSVSGILTLNGAGVSGMQVELCRQSSSACQRVATAVSGANGAYAFPAVDLPASGLTHYVRYWNLGNTPGRLFYWAEPVQVVAGKVNAARTFDIGDIVLKQPTAGASVSLPFTFNWAMRPAPGAANDQYQIHLSGKGYDPWWWEVLGHTGSYALKSLPAARSGQGTFKYGTPYQWEVWACTPQGGCGLSLESRKVTFNQPPTPQPAASQELSGPEQVLTAGQQAAQELYYADDLFKGER